MSAPIESAAFAEAVTVNGDPLTLAKTSVEVVGGEAVLLAAEYTDKDGRVVAVHLRSMPL